VTVSTHDLNFTAHLYLMICTKITKKLS